MRCGAWVEHRSAHEDYCHWRSGLHRLGGGPAPHRSHGARGAGPRQVDLCGQSRFARVGARASPLSIQPYRYLRSSGRRRCFSQASIPMLSMHLAAESHVDRSIDGPAEFINTNVVGTYVLLEAALAHWRKLGARAQNFGSSTSRPMRSMARSPTRGVSRRRPATTRARPTRPARLPPTTWCAHGDTPMACPSSSPTARTTMALINFPKS